MRPRHHVGPPGGGVSRGLRTLLAAVVAAAALAPAAAGAFTLIEGTAAVFVNPSSAYPTTPFKLLGNFTYPGGCPPGPYTFRFNFDSTEVWTVNVTVCDPNTFVWSTGWSPGIKPPAPASPGAHKVTLTVYGPPGNVPAAPAVSKPYTINRPPPSPTPTPRQSPPATQPSPSPNCATGAAGCASPPASPSQCPVTGALPPPGTGGFVDNFIATAMLAAVVPIVGLALFSPMRILTAIGRRRRVLQLLGLTLLVSATLSCTSSVAGIPNQSPPASTAAQASPSPSPSPSPGC